MLTLDATTSTLLVIDLQARLVPVLEGGADAVKNTRRLLDAAAKLGVPALFTEQNPRALGATVPSLSPAPAPESVVAKMAFSAVRAPGLLDRLAPHHVIVIAGCEAHVCVLQTVLDLRERDRTVFVVRDAIASRRGESKETAIQRMARHGAEIITTEMAVFEWLGTAEHPKFKETSALIK